MTEIQRRETLVALEPELHLWLTQAHSHSGDEAARWLQLQDLMAFAAWREYMLPRFARRLERPACDRKVAGPIPPNQLEILA